MQSVLKNKINFSLTPSLEHTALAKIAITLWWKDDVKDHMEKSFCLLEDSWRDIENAVIEKSSELPLPEILKEKLLGFIVAVGLQILSWIDFHMNRNKFVTDLPATLFWTSLGTIDNKRTAEILLKDASINVHTRLELACIYCLENEIRHLWEKLNYFEREDAGRSSVILVWYWSMYLEDDWSGLRRYGSNLTPFESVFEESVKSGNEAATRYFWGKLDSDDKDNFIIRLASLVGTENSEHPQFSEDQCSGVFLFLFSTMNAEQQAKLFKNDTYTILTSLLVWPWQSLFLETAKSNLDFLSKEEYAELLEHIVISMYYRHNLQQLFAEFWHQSPEAYKQFIIDSDTLVLLLHALQDREDYKNMELIWKWRKDLIFSERSQDIFRYMVFYKMWDSIEFLIRKFISSQDEMIKFRDLIRTWKISFDKSWLEKVLQLVEDYVLEYKKEHA